MIRLHRFCVMFIGLFVYIVRIHIYICGVTTNCGRDGMVYDSFTSFLCDVYRFVCILYKNIFICISLLLGWFMG